MYKFLFLYVRYLFQLYSFNSAIIIIQQLWFFYDWLYDFNENILMTIIT